MLNEIHIEGAVTRVWKFGQARFARIACRVDPGRPAPSEANGRESQYVTLRFEAPLVRAAGTLKQGALVRAHGYLTSREYDISLANFSRSAETEDTTAKERLDKLAETKGDVIAKPHVLNEVMVERFEVLEEG